MVPTRRSSGSSGSVMVIHEEASVMPYATVMRATPISSTNRCMSSMGHGAPPTIPFRTVPQSFV